MQFRIIGECLMDSSEGFLFHCYPQGPLLRFLNKGFSLGAIKHGLEHSCGNDYSFGSSLYVFHMVN